MDLFNILLKESKNGNFVFETQNKTHNIEVEVSYSTQEIEVRFYKGKNLIPEYKDSYHSLHGMFGNSDCETKFMDILKTFKH